MLNLIQADIYRVLHSTTIKILLTMTTVFSVILFGGMYLVANGTINQDLTNIIFLASDMNMVTLIGAVLAITHEQFQFTLVITLPLHVTNRT